MCRLATKLARTAGGVRVRRYERWRASVVISCPDSFSSRITVDRKPGAFVVAADCSLYSGQCSEWLSARERKFLMPVERRCWSS